MVPPTYYCIFIFIHCPLTFNLPSPSLPAASLRDLPRRRAQPTAMSSQPSSSASRASAPVSLPYTQPSHVPSTAAAPLRSARRQHAISCSILLSSTTPGSLELIPGRRGLISALFRSPSNLGRNRYFQFGNPSFSVSKPSPLLSPLATVHSFQSNGAASFFRISLNWSFRTNLQPTSLNQSAGSTSPSPIFRIQFLVSFSQSGASPPFRPIQIFYP